MRTRMILIAALVTTLASISLIGRSDVVEDPPPKAGRNLVIQDESRLEKPVAYPDSPCGILGLVCTQNQRGLEPTATSEKTPRVCRAFFDRRSPLSSNGPTSILQSAPRAGIHLGTSLAIATHRKSKVQSKSKV